VLLTKYYSVDRIEKKEMGWKCSAYEERRGACMILVGKTEGKRPLGRPRPRLEDKIKMDFQEVGCGA
jgi:hypothetical protein